MALDFTINGGKPQVFARAACKFRDGCTLLCEVFVLWYICSHARVACPASMNVTAEVVSNGAAALSNVLIESTKVSVACADSVVSSWLRTRMRLWYPDQNRLAKDKFLLSVADFPMPDGHKTALAEVREWDCLITVRRLSLTSTPWYLPS